MGQITTYKNTPITIDIQFDVIDNGWTVVGGKAVHHGCNQGNIKNLNIPTIEGKEYTIIYQVENYSSGLVRIKVGGVDGEERTSNGIFTETITALDDTGVLFYSDGNLSVGILKVADGVLNGVTFSYNEEARAWVSYYSFIPEYMNKFLDKFITFRDGQLWTHHTNPIRNNYYGQQFTSQVKFYCNLNPTEVKQFFSIREKSNKVWSVTDAYISPSEGKSEGQRTRLKKGRFRNLQGDFFGDFLRNLEDPRFVTELEALMKGSEMQGSVMEITLENTDTTEVRLLSVDVLVAPKSYTY